MVRKKFSELSNAECIKTVCMVGVFSIIANIIMPLPTGLLPVFLGFGIVFIITLIYLAVRKNPNSSSRSHRYKSPALDYPTPIKKSRILCIKCNSPVESDQEFCQQCGHKLN